jgi:diguanylate cyclase (GGDEF)-like protein/PAS domain S-box-containing protein
MNKEDKNFIIALIETMPDPFFYKDCKGVFIMVNDAFLNFIGLDSDEIINKTAFDLMPIEIANEYADRDKAIIESKSSQTFETRLTSLKGSIKDVILYKTVHLDSKGNSLGIFTIIHDVTERKRAEMEVRMLHEIKDVFLDINHHMIGFDHEKALMDILLKKLMTIFQACQCATVLEIKDKKYLTVLSSHGFEQDALSDFRVPLDKSFIWREVPGKLQSAQIVNNIQSYIETGFPGVSIPSSGKPIQSSLIVPIIIRQELKWIFNFDSDKNHTYTETDRKVADFIREELPLLYRIFELYLETKHLSQYDRLTGLLNRGYFDSVLEKLFDNPYRSYIIVLFDLDGLKKINDLYGHGAGDLYIQSFSTLLKSTIHKNTYTARIGGDEFAIMMPATPFKLLNEKVLDMRKTFEENPIVSMDKTFYGSFSFGIAQFPRDADEKSKLFHVADLFMYRDKLRKK